VLAACLMLGCGRGQSVAEEGEIRVHPRGFGVLVPDGWTVSESEGGLRLVSQAIHGAGHPSIRIEALTAHELPGDFLTGRSFRWSGDRASYHYQRFSNALGNGFELTVHRSGRSHYFVVQALIWDDRLTMDRRFFRKQIWPIINSIEEVDAGEG